MSRPGPSIQKILTNIEIASNIWAITTTWTGYPIAPGQFVAILPEGTSALTLRRPLSVADVADDFSTLTLIYRVVGEGTYQLSQLQPSSGLDVLGPLGNGFKTDTDDSKPQLQSQPQQPQALLIGGGVGVPPLYLLGRRLAAQGWQVTTHIGMRNADELFWVDKFASIGTVQIATDDGSAGTCGTVATLGVDHTPTAVFACGPNPMLRYVKQRWAEVTLTQLSLEGHMACTTGACYACVVKDVTTSNKQHRICFDGPVFNAKAVEL